MDTITITVKIKKETEKAILVNGWSYEGWLPKSQITVNDTDDGNHIVEIPGWLARKKGIVTSADIRHW